MSINIFSESDTDFSNWTKATDIDCSDLQILEELLDMSGELAELESECNGEVNLARIKVFVMMGAILWLIRHIMRVNDPNYLIKNREIKDHREPEEKDLNSFSISQKRVIRGFELRYLEERIKQEKLVLKSIKKLKKNRTLVTELKLEHGYEAHTELVREKKKNLLTYTILSVCIGILISFIPFYILSTHHKFYVDKNDIVNFEMIFLGISAFIMAIAAFFPKIISTRLTNSLNNPGIEKIHDAENMTRQLETKISEAKSNLPELKANQIYANLSVDVLRTDKGQATSAGLNITEITIEVVVSADIIEYY